MFSPARRRHGLALVATVAYADGTGSGVQLALWSVGSEVVDDARLRLNSRSSLCPCVLRQEPHCGLLRLRLDIRVVASTADELHIVRGDPFQSHLQPGNAAAFAFQPTRGNISSQQKLRSQKNDAPSGVVVCADAGPKPNCRGTVCRSRTAEFKRLRDVAPHGLEGRGDRIAWRRKRLDGVAAFDTQRVRGTRHDPNIQAELEEPTVGRLPENAWAERGTRIETQPRIADSFEVAAPKGELGSPSGLVRAPRLRPMPIRADAERARSSSWDG